MRARFFTKHYLVFTLSLLLTSCGLSNLRQVPVSSPSLAKAEPPVKEKSNSLSRRLLNKAEELYDSGHFLSPAEDNAYIRFQALKMLEPSSEEAQAGLDAILIHEASLVKDMLAASKYSAAGRRIRELEQFFPEAATLSKLRVNLAQARERAKRKAQALAAASSRKKSASSAARAPDRMYLDVAGLDQQAPALIQQLESLAIKVSKSHQGVLIYARSDAEGRWIYQQMRKATPNYRIRGDIRIGKPAIKLLSPFGEK